MRDRLPPPDDLDPALVEDLARRAKTVLRKRARGLRGSVAQAVIEEKSRAIVARLLDDADVGRARSVGLFWPIEGRKEVDLRALDPALRARGVAVHYPAIDPETRAMTFRDPGDPARMAERGFGFEEPDPGAPEASALDVVVCPALLVDPSGSRLGYGAGYYDRALPRLCPPGRAIAVAFSFQLVVDLPTTPNDVRVSRIVTDDRVIDG
jgi:5-formyltetrahydrofolate cyclo-ligase